MGVVAYQGQSHILCIGSDRGVIFLNSRDDELYIVLTLITDPAKPIATYSGFYMTINSVTGAILEQREL